MMEHTWDCPYAKKFIFRSVKEPDFFSKVRLLSFSLRNNSYVQVMVPAFIQHISFYIQPTSCFVLCLVNIYLLLYCSLCIYDSQYFTLHRCPKFSMSTGSELIRRASFCGQATVITSGFLTGFSEDVKETVQLPKNHQLATYPKKVNKPFSGMV